MARLSYAEKTGQMSPEQRTAYLVHLLAHTRRMLQMLDESPQHPRAVDYLEEIALNKAEWSAAANGGRSEALASVLAIHDMTPDLLQATVIALET